MSSVSLKQPGREVSPESFNFPLKPNSKNAGNRLFCGFSKEAGEPEEAEKTNSIVFKEEILNLALNSLGYK